MFVQKRGRTDGGRKHEKRTRGWEEGVSAQWGACGVHTNGRSLLISDLPERNPGRGAPDQAPALN